MPSRKTHSIIGGSLGLSGSLTILVLSSEELIPSVLFAGAQSGGDLAAYIALATFTGWLGGILPDLLEPGDQNPHHRSFFHSIAILVALILFLVTIAWGIVLSEDTLESLYLRAIVFFTSVGYLSHLLLDLFTPYRLPWIK